MKDYVVSGAARGGGAWLVYAVVETVLSISVQLWRFPEMEVLGWQWRLIALLVSAYFAIGVILGATGSLLLKRTKAAHAEQTTRLWAVLTLVSAFTVNLMTAWPLARSEYIALALSVGLAGTLAAAMTLGRAKQVQFLASPWTVSLLLLGAPWISREALDSRTSPWLKTAFSLLAVSTIVAGAALANRLRRGQVAKNWGRAVLTTLIIGIFVLTTAIAGRQPSIRIDPRVRTAATTKPNVLLITMDTVRADHTSVYGYERDTTPNLRQLCRDATVYTRAIAASDFTLPTHGALFTGLYPNWSGALAAMDPRPGHIADPLRPETVTLAEILRSRGYWTAEVAANFGFLGPWTGLTRGFDVTDLRRPVTLSTGDRPFYLRAMARRLLGQVSNMAPLERPSLTAADINDRALELLEAVKVSGAPFFMFLNYMDAHTPYVPSPPFDRRFPGFDSGLDPYSFHDLKLQVASGKRQILPNERTHLIAQYDGGIAEEDSAIGAILNRLRQLGLYDNTLIVITADHGDTFGEHGLADHFLGFVYQELVHIPLIIKYPRQRHAKRSDELVSQVDVFPTVLDLVETRTASELQGRSLLRPAAVEDLVVYSQGTRSGLVGVGNPRFNGLRRAAFAKSLKLIAWTSGPSELYDLATDPTEQHNIYHLDDPRATKLSDRLRHWVSTMPPRKAPTKIDRSTAERLKSLGYIQ